MITTSKTSPAAKSRFLQIPGTPGLLEIPSSVFSVLTSPLRGTLLSAVLSEPFRPLNRSRDIKDESLDAFMTRRFGEPFARIFGSALVHGIYAADSRKLSVRAAFPSLWTAEERGWGSIVRGFLRPYLDSSQKNDYDIGGISQLLKGVSVYSFRDGMQALTSALEHYLSSQSNVSILRSTDAALLQLKEDKSFEVSPFPATASSSAKLVVKITLSSGSSVTPTHIVSTLPLPILNTLLPKQNALPHLTTNPYTSVFVVNLVFSVPPSEIHPEGFGYLIPRPSSDYSHMSPGILGTVFDSCSVQAQDSSTQLTKLTVMLGGPHRSLALANTSVHVIVKHLEEHLQRQLPHPIFSRVWHNKECIPTLMPGHLERMEEMRSVLKDRWDGRMEVIGAGVGGVSVGDCVEAGKRAGESWT